jgi:hypothetical protein
MKYVQSPIVLPNSDALQCFRFPVFRKSLSGCTVQCQQSTSVLDSSWQPESTNNKRILHTSRSNRQLKIMDLLAQRLDVTLSWPRIAVLHLQHSHSYSEFLMDMQSRPPTSTVRRKASYNRQQPCSTMACDPACNSLIFK